MYRNIIVVLMLAILPACTTVVGISPSTTPITSEDSYTVIGPATGRSTGAIWFFIPTMPDTPSKNARDNAIASKHADGLIEVTEEYTVFSLLLVTFVWTTVDGTAIKIKRGGALGAEK
ncbi:MAG TPA: hypothetical protein DET40_23530 [Lentisphaeria bacterium]|nr:MAG: hypothetical protein A2X45_23745 [Lentisphaerae bacterium GWF2_50_93]HCE46528.1 hypothetical protein [Lentisphaeria bacterium]